jgi:uncharacterized protein YggU (UPF0235/DUF167 family)
VGGDHGGALVVRVSPRAVDGQATAAALAAVAGAFGVRRSAVTLVAGATSRTKVLDVAGAEPAELTRLLALSRRRGRSGRRPVPAPPAGQVMLAATRSGRSFPTARSRTSRRL